MFARAVVPHGTGAMVIDPHEFTMVIGKRESNTCSVDQRSADRFFHHASVVYSGHALGQWRTSNRGGSRSRLTTSESRAWRSDELPGLFLGMESELAKVGQARES